MADYSATVTADMSGYTTSMQQALAMTKEYAAANEGLYGLIGRTGTRAINTFNEALGQTQKAMKANVSEAANYQQALGKVSANAVAANKNVGDTTRATKEIAREMTGSIGSAVEVVSAVQKMGFAEPKGIKEMSKAMIELGAATGESGAGITASLMNVQRSYGAIPSGESISALGDALVSTSAKFGASAGAVANFSENISPFAEQIGMSKTAVIGFSTAFARMGESGYRSSNVFSKVLSDIDKAVRDGLPTLGIYAETMGKTYAETRRLAKEDPTEFILQFTEALSKQGEQGVRTLEQLGLEGVRSQKAIKALTTGGEARAAVEQAQKSYGGGTTAEAAQEALTGINEQAAKLQESLGQVAANSGAPMLQWMETLGKVSGTAADGLAKLTGSSGFQTVMKYLAGGVAVAGIGSKLLGGAFAIGGLGATYSQLNEMGRLTRAQEALGRNRNRLIGGGIAGLALGQMTGAPGINTLAMGSLIAGSVLPGGLGATRKAWEFLTKDTIGALNTRMRAPRDADGQVIRDASGRPVGGWGSDMGRTSRLNQYYTEGAGYQEARRADQETRKAERLLRVDTGISMVDVQEDTSKRMEERFKPEQISDEHKAKLKKLSQMVDESGKDLKYKTELLNYASAVREGVNPAGLEEYLDDLEEKAAKAPPPTAKARAKYQGRQIGKGLQGIAAGGFSFLEDATGIGLGAMMSPAGIVAGGVAAGGIAVYNEVNENRRLQGRIESTDLSSNTQKVAEAFGLVSNQFSAITTAGNDLTNTFENLSKSSQKQIDEGITKGGTPDLTLSPQEFTNIEDREPVASLKFQSYRLGPFAAHSEIGSPEATAELLATYGTEMTGDVVAAMKTDLKAQGESFGDVNKSLESVAGILGNSDKTLDLVAKNFAVRGPTDTEYTEAGSELMKTWVANRTAEGMSDRARAEEVNEMILRNSGGMDQGALDKFVKDTYERAGIVGVGQPGFKAGSVGANDYNAMSPEEKEAEDKKRIAANEAAKAAFELRTFGQKLGAREAAMESFGIGRGTSTLAEMMRASAEQQARANVPGRNLEELSLGAPSQARTEELSAKRAQENDAAYQKQVAAAGTIADSTAALAEAFEPGKVGSNLAAVRGIGMGTTQFYGGDTGAALEAARAEARQHAPESNAGQVAAMTVASIQEERERAFKGMDPFAAMETRMKDANTHLANVRKDMDAGMEGAEEEFAAAQQEAQSARDSAVDFMQNYLKGARNLDRQLGYMAEDYAKSVKYANQDYATQQAQAQEQFDISQQRAKRDHLKQMLYMEQDYQKQIDRSTRQYDLQRERMAEDHAKQMLRHYEDMAKGAMDIYTRIGVESTWSARGLLSNMEEQADMMAKQLENLDKLRAKGVNQSAIDMLGLNDPGKAQQLDRLVGDLSGAGSQELISGINTAAGNRTSIATQLFGPENDINTRRMEDDYRSSMDRMAEDRRTWLEDAENDYQQSRQRTEDSFQTQMKDARESFDLSMQYMADSHSRAMARMAESQQTAIKRAREGFNAMYEGMTSDFNALQEQTNNYLKTGTAEWPKIVTDGAKASVHSFEDTMGDINAAWGRSISAAMATAYADNGKMQDATDAMITFLGLADKLGTGGGPGPGDFGPKTPLKNAPMSSEGYNDVTGGKGEITNRWHAPGHYGKSGKGWHTGSDVGVPVGTPVKAVQDGRVVSVNNTGSAGYGLHITLQDANEDIQIIYGHLSKTFARAGQNVKAGDIMAYSGNTGNSSGPHLHVEARKPPYKYGNDVFPGPWMFEGGIAMNKTLAGIGEKGPEAVIPLNQRGIDILASALQKAYAMANTVGTMRQGEGGNTYISYVTNEDHSVTVSGPVKVVSDDPEKIGRELERRSRMAALVSPNRRSS